MSLSEESRERTNSSNRWRRVRQLEEAEFSNHCAKLWRQLDFSCLSDSLISELKRTSLSIIIYKLFAPQDILISEKEDKIKGRNESAKEKRQLIRALS